MQYVHVLQILILRNLKDRSGFEEGGQSWHPHLDFPEYVQYQEKKLIFVTIKKENSNLIIVDCNIKNQVLNRNIDKPLRKVHQVYYFMQN